MKKFKIGDECETREGNYRRLLAINEDLTDDDCRKYVWADMNGTAWQTNASGSHLLSGEESHLDTVPRKARGVIYIYKQASGAFFPSVMPTNRDMEWVASVRWKEGEFHDIEAKQ